MPDLTEARKEARTDSSAAAIAWAQDRIDALEDALRLPLMLHDGYVWTEERRAEWWRITGTVQVTPAVMCQHIRNALTVSDGLDEPARL